MWVIHIVLDEALPIPRIPISRSSASDAGKEAAEGGNYDLPQQFGKLGVNIKNLAKLVNTEMGGSQNRGPQNRTSLQVIGSSWSQTAARVKSLQPADQIKLLPGEPSVKNGLVKGYTPKWQICGGLGSKALSL